MSKRYGRNQKRKHLEKIKNLELAYNRELSLLNDISDKKDRIRRKYEELCENIEYKFKNSALIDPKTIASDFLPNRINIEILNPVSFSNFDHHFEFNHHVTLERIEVLSKDDEMRSAKHILIRSKHGDVGYYISESALFNTKKEHHYYLSKMITEKILFVLADGKSDSTQTQPKRKNQLF